LRGSGAALLKGICRGLEKEGLRVDASTGMLAQTPHPAALGAALTHPGITTDYSESLLEFITPVASDVNTTLTQLDELHRFTASSLSEELVGAPACRAFWRGTRVFPLRTMAPQTLGR